MWEKTAVMHIQAQHLLCSGVGEEFLVSIAVILLKHKSFFVVDSYLLSSNL